MKPDAGWWHTSELYDGRIIVTLTGEIDMRDAGQLLSILTDAVQRADAVVVDLAGVRFIDSTVIGSLVRGHTTAVAKGCRFTVENPTAQVRRVLQITGILGILST